MKYRRLDAWAEREQRRFDQRRSTPARVPGTEPTAARILQAFLGTFAMAVKCIIIPMFLVKAIALIALHTAQSLALSVAMLMLFGFSAFTTAVTLHARRQNGRNWLTGLAPKVQPHRQSSLGT